MLVTVSSSSLWGKEKWKRDCNLHKIGTSCGVDARSKFVATIYSGPSCSNFLSNKSMQKKQPLSTFKVIIIKLTSSLSNSNNQPYNFRVFGRDHMIMEESGIIEVSLLVHEEKSKGSGEDSSHVTAVAVFSTAVAVCGAFTNGCAIGYTSPAETGIMDDLGLSVAEYSVFGSIITIGGIVGAAVSGKLTDLIGRRGTMWISDILCIMGWLAIALAKDYWWLDLGRLSVGLGVGLICYVVPIYISEIMPKNIRGGFTSANSLMICCGSSVTFFLGTVVSWRILAVIGAIPCVLQVIGLFFIPESPRWLAMVSQEARLEAALQTLRGKNVDISDEAGEIREYTEAFQQHSKARVLDLFRRRYAHSLIVGVGLMVLQQFGGTNAILYYASSIFESAGISATFGARAMAILQVPVTILGILLIDKSGRRPLLMVSAAGMCMSCLVVSLSFLLQDLQLSKGLTPTLALIGILAYLASVSMGVAGLPWVVMSEIFPINIKGSAGSLVNITNLFCSWITTYTFNFVFEWSSAGTFFLFSIICGATVLFVEKMLPETKGRRLEEIQATMAHFLQ